MQEALRVENITKLMIGIAAIAPGALFERFGAKFLDHHFPSIKFNHRGLNVLNNPVGSTIDSYDDAQEIGAEYSRDEDYFTGQWLKPIKDVLHAKRKHHGVRHLYLLSAQEAPLAGVPTFATRIGQWPGFGNLTLHFYDSRRLAEVIVDEMLLDDAALGALVEHLPVLGRIANESIATLSVPPVNSRRIQFTNVATAIEQRLTDAAPVLALSGISGSGKSDAAAAYVNASQDRYQTPIWVSGGDLTSVADLKAKRLFRGGASLNVAGMLTSRRCLLVIDDLSPDISLDDLSTLCGPGSHILVTRREVGPGDVTLPDLSREEAKSILDRDVAPCPEPVLDALIATVGGHPLSLALVNTTVASGATWEQIQGDCEAVPELEVGRERLADRMLGRLRGVMDRELTVFEWGGRSSGDARFFDTAIGAIGMSKIKRQGLLAADGASIIRLHDIVFASLMTQRWLTPERSLDLADRFEAHLAQVIEEESLALRIVATTMRTKLEGLIAAGDLRPAFLTALLEIWEPEEIDLAAVGDPMATAQALASTGKSVGYAEVRAVLEAIEGLYRHAKPAGLEYARAEYEARLPIFDVLAGLTGLTPATVSGIKHHRAKALKILKRDEEAITEWEAVLAGPFPLNATRLQLVRAYSKKQPDRAAELADEIFTAAHVPLAVTSYVVLGAVEALPWARGDWREKLFARHGDLIAREIKVAADAGLDQAYSALASLGRYWSWHDPKRLAAIASAVPMPTPSGAAARALGSIGEVLSQAAKTGTDIDRATQEKALKYFEAVPTPDDYGIQKHGQLLIEMDRFGDAAIALARIADIGTKPWAAYRLSQAKLGEGEALAALQLIDAAIHGLTDARYTSTFYAHRFEVRHALSDQNAADDLRFAVNACDEPKYKAVLQGRLGALLA